MSTELPDFKKFVSEEDIAEARKKRQEEWEKVRTPDQPVDAPEEPYDSRSLWERLEANRIKKQEEYDETHRLKNMVKGLENDEIEFLEKVSQQQELIEQRRILEEKVLLAEFKQAVVNTVSDTPSTSTTLKRATEKPPQKSQRQLLAGVVRKRSVTEPFDEAADQKKFKATSPKLEQIPPSRLDGPLLKEDGDEAVQRIGDGRILYAVLPGIGTYSSSESSDEGLDEGQGRIDTSSSSSDFDEGIPWPTKPKVVVQRDTRDEGQCQTE